MVRSTPRITRCGGTRLARAVRGSRGRWQRRWGVVNQGDYNVWRLYFGETIGGSGAGGIGSVPEPASFVLLLNVLAVVLLRRRRCNAAG